MAITRDEVAREQTPPAEPMHRPHPGRTIARSLVTSGPALTALIILAVIVATALLAPVYAHHVARTDPFVSHLNATVNVGGKSVPVMQESTGGLGLGVTPIGPTWHAQYFLGADSQGRDVMSRVLYGSRVSLVIGFVSAVICCVVATVLGVLAGYLGGITDGILSRVFDIVWAFPVFLLAICLSIVFLTSTFHLGPFTIDSGSLVLPIAIIAVVYIPYVARPIRAQVRSLRERTFVQAARSVGSSDRRILVRDILPNVLPSVIVYVPIMMALNILIGSSLSFLGVGVQPPRASWGTVINDGLNLLYTRPLVSLAPGILLALTCIALNIIGDALRDALDPGSKVRGAA